MIENIVKFTNHLTTTCIDFKIKGLVEKLDFGD